MTRVRFRYARPAATGLDIPLAGRELVFGLVNREDATGVIRVTDTFSVVLDAAGVAVVSLSPTSATQGWRVKETWARGAEIHVYGVPASQSILDATDLPELDAASLAPLDTAIPGYLAALDAVADRVRALELTGVPTEALEDAVEAQLIIHVEDPTPHPSYDDMPSLNLLFENGLI